MSIFTPLLGSQVLDCLPGTTSTVLHAEDAPRLLLVESSEGAALLGHLEDNAEGSLWSLIPVHDDQLEELRSLELDDWDDEGWDEAYDLLDEDASALLLQTDSLTRVCATAEVSPRPAELEALLDAALDVFDAE